ncbi:hypothetical protein [Microlunatus parietis]|uniref:Nucleotidyl transferase AbiEii toxin, Type IV TA system n=1 Tax=Microlunatus parietis TaxID=682979 RepID=A0A7Y9I8H5_9ACTN|nr:hypothetical protein [Microlunatus parietis]NYE71674.1 hypothetical protein [Microlunatus parietis]
MAPSERAVQLEGEATRLLAQLDLGSAFGWRPQVIGSVRSGLLVLRDLDVMFDAPDATAPMILAGLAALAERVVIMDADFRDERGDRRPTSKITDERFYLVLKLGDGWKVDLTFWLHAVERPHVADALRLRELPAAQRELILRLKTECPDYPERIGGSEIYRAVLDRGVRTVDELRS